MNIEEKVIKESRDYKGEFVRVYGASGTVFVSNPNNFGSFFYVRDIQNVIDELQCIKSKIDNENL